jgi:hypothetical protein
MELALLKSKTVQKIIFGVVVAILALASVGMIVYLQKTGKIGQLISGLIGRLAVEKEASPPVQEKPAEKLTEEVLPPKPKVYEKEAKKGEGITHLARKALNDYLAETKMEINLTPEHKIFIEDYLKDKTGDYWLKPGQKISFSEELIVEAINQALKLTPEQLQNLKKYSALVPTIQ